MSPPLTPRDRSLGLKAGAYNAMTSLRLGCAAGGADGVLWRLREPVRTTRPDKSAL
jgi:hypothetical protein